MAPISLTWKKNHCSSSDFWVCKVSNCHRPTYQIFVSVHKAKTHFGDV